VCFASSFNNGCFTFKPPFWLLFKCDLSFSWLFVVMIACFFEQFVGRMSVRRKWLRVEQCEIGRWVGRSTKLRGLKMEELNVMFGGSSEHWALYFMARRRLKAVIEFIVFLKKKSFPMWIIFDKLAWEYTLPCVQYVYCYSGILPPLSNNIIGLDLPN